MLLSDQWEMAKEEKTDAPVAVIKKEDKELAKFFVVKHTGKARELSDAWREEHGLEKDAAREYLSEKGFASFKSISKNDKEDFKGAKGTAKAVVFIQPKDDEVIELRMEAGLAEADALKEYVEDVAKTLQPASKKGGLIEDIGKGLEDGIKKGGGLIPLPF